MRALSLFMTVAYVLLMTDAPTVADGGLAARVRAVVRQPEVQRATSYVWLVATEGRELSARDRVRTGEHDRVIIEYEDGSELWVDVSSELVVGGSADDSGLVLGQLVDGRLWARVSPASGSAVRLTAGTAEVHVERGDLRLSIEDQDAVVLVVLEGLALMEAEGESVVVYEGQRCLVEPGRRPARPTDAGPAELRWPEFAAPPASEQPVPPRDERERPAGGALLGLAGVGLLLAALGGGGGGGTMYQPPPDVYLAPAFADAAIQTPETLRSILAPSMQDRPGDARVTCWSGRTTSAEIGVEAGGRPWSVTTCLAGSWRPGRSPYAPTLRAGLAATGSPGSGQEGRFAYAGLSVTRDESTSLTLELRDWRGRMVGDQRWAVALLSLTDECRLAIGRDLRHDTKACLLEYQLRW